MKRIGVLAFGLLGTVAFVHCGTDSNGTGGDNGGGSDAGTDTTQGGGDDGSSSGDDGNAKPTCGNGVVETPEECDKGSKNAPGSGCERDCTFTCVAGETGRGDDHCNDGNACNGAETCAADHSCKPGTPLGQGDACDTGKVCNGGNCVATTCGDGIVTAPEECDDGNTSNGDGCDTSCRFSCVSNDPTRDCASTDPCAGNGACTDATHTCTAGTPLGDGTGCGPGSDAGASDAAAGSVCKGGVCTAPSCGDGVVEAPNEDCDFGSGNGAGTGCELNCKFSCSKTDANACPTQDLCAGTNACTTVTFGDAGSRTGQKCVVGTPPPDNTPCGPGNAGKCTGHVCILSTCGNGTVENGEQCDFGSGNNVAGSGCDPDCQFSCQTTPKDTCPNTDLCLASPQKCGPVTVNGKPGQKCGPATPIAACAACTSGGSSGVCVSNKCQNPQCGDGCITGPGETCEPPNTQTCDSSCHKIVCGDSAIEGDEQCDDGNKTNLDGCDSTCHFEQDHRANAVQLKFQGDAVCTKDALGSAIASAAQSTINGSLSTGVWDGSTTIAFKFLGLTDLTGTGQDGGLSLGALSGAPEIPSGKAYDGGADLDWWYATSDASIDPSRTPTSILAATLSQKKLTASGAVNIGIILAGAPASLHMSGAKILANVGGVSKPKVSTDGKSPGHLPAENLVPSLQSFDSMTGTLCGNISAKSLDQVPVPAALLPGGADTCDEGYTSSNHLLDVLMNGCTHTVVIVPIGVINKTPPDAVDSSQPVLGAGPGASGSYTLTSTGVTVTGCKDKSGGVVDFQSCLNAAAYSSYFSFTTDRVIMK